jgi:hypothetical protein
MGNSLCLHGQIGDILSLPLFRNFEATAITLVRSERLSAEDKVALGTIKRFGEQRTKMINIAIL